MVQLAHLIGRHAKRDDDLGERMALFQALEHERGELALRQLARANRGLLDAARCVLLGCVGRGEPLDVLGTRGDAYRAYQRRVSRFLPLPPKRDA